MGDGPGRIGIGGPGGGLGPAGQRGGHHVPQPGGGGGVGEPEQIHRDHACDKPRQLAIGDPHHQQLAAGRRVVGPGGLPLGPAVDRFQVVAGQDGDGAGGLLDAPVHALDPVGPGHEIPRLDQHRVAVFLQHPGDPFRPRPVGLGVGDEKIPPLVRIPARRHDSNNPIRPGWRSNDQHRDVGGRDCAGRSFSWPDVVRPHVARATWMGQRRAREALRDLVLQAQVRTGGTAAEAGVGGWVRRAGRAASSRPGRVALPGLTHAGLVVGSLSLALGKAVRAFGLS